METILFLSLGLFIGALSAWFIAKFKFASESNKISNEELNQQYVQKAVLKHWKSSRI